MPVLAKNVLSEYLAIGVSLALGVLMLPFNMAHLGASTYGVWVLATSITTYFDVLELGYGSSQVKFTAQYRARRDAEALNEVTSTLFFLFIGIGVLQYALAMFVAANMERWFNLEAGQAAMARMVLLIVTVYMAVGLPFSVFGSVTNGFQRYHWNNLISVGTSIAAAIANVIVLRLGYGIVELVATTTAIRLLSLIAYRRSAYRAFPPLRIRWQHVRRSRLREVTAFSAFLLIIDIARKVNFTSDTMVISAFLGTAAVATWTVGARITQLISQLTRVLSRKLFPNIVDAAEQNQAARSRQLLVHGTRLSLAMVTPMAAVTAVLAGPLISAWVGDEFSAAVPVLQVLALITAIRTGALTSHAVLKATDGHRFLAAATVTMALTNLGLSILFVRWFGLVGIAVGTLIPAALGSGAVIFPAACRAVQLPLTAALRQAVWPAVWPAVPLAAILAAAVTVTTLPTWLLALIAVAAALLYLAIFFRWALPVDERQWYSSKIASLLRPGGLLPA